MEGLVGMEDGIVHELAERLAAAGYREEVLFRAEAVVPGQLDAVRLPMVEWSLERQGLPGPLLARLFLYSSQVPEGPVRTALGPRLSEALLEAGVLEFSGNEAVRARFRVTPLEGIWVFSDPPEAGGDAVMGPGITTLDLVRLVPREPRAVLDLGCGAGTLALVAALRGASRALGVDINPRAVALAEFNARLNRSSARFRAGDLLAPVAGERFDLVVSQPPYVVQPAGIPASTYLHGGPSGDAIALRFAAEVPGALAPGGRALLLFDSGQGSRPPLHRRLEAALGQAPVDLHVLAAPGPSPDHQAVAYASLEAPRLGKLYRAAVRRYREHLEASGVSSFVRALVVLVESGGRRDHLSFQLPVSSLSGLDAAALERFLGGLALARSPEPALMRAAVRVSPGARFVEERPASDPEGAPARSIQFEKGSLGSDREISEAGLVLFSALSASPSVEAAAAAFAAACGEKVEGVRPRVVEFVREGLARALLVPGDVSPRG